MKNIKGFTLVELLAVIVIMGILMMIAIPSVSRVIENSRKDTFIDITKSYANAAKTLWTSDNLTCDGINASAVDDGDYYILINTTESARASLPVLVDQGGKSSWGNRDVNGYVRVHVDTIESPNNNTTRTTTFFASLTDGTHGVIDNGLTTADNLQRGNVLMTISTPKVYRVQLTADDGTLQCKKITTGGYSCTEVAPVTDVSGICIDDSSTVTSIGTTTVKTWIPKYFAYGQYKDASKIAAASTTNYASISHRVMGAVDIAEETNGLCVNDGSSIFCIKSNNMKNTKKQLAEYFGESNCQDEENGSYYRCNSSNFSCRSYSDGKLTCHDYANNEYCSAYTNGKLNCYTGS